MSIDKKIGSIFTIIVAVCGSIFFLEGCVIKEIGRSIKHTVQGEYYLSNSKYTQGQETFLGETKKNPSDASSHYYLGRLLIAEEKVTDALPYFKKAVSLNSGKADYNFWLGVTHGALGQIKKERSYYEKALLAYGQHLQARTYLAHVKLKSKEYNEALADYQKVLKAWPESPSALYNRALIMQKLGRTLEEENAWLKYLDIYPAGSLSRRAADNLNKLGRFTYRNYKLGLRTITLHKIEYSSFSSNLESSSYPSLNFLAEILENMKKETLQVVFYQKNNLSLAKKRAKSIKEYILNKKPQIKRQRISLSWFDVPEEINVSGKKFIKEESVTFFMTK